MSVRRTVPVLLACIVVGGALRAAEAPPPRLEIGKPVEPFTLLDVHKKEVVSLADLSAKDKRAVAVLFIATQCPVSNAYNERMEALHKAYAKKGIQFVGINSNRQEPVAEIVDHAKKHGLTFPILKDTDNKIADLYHASVTPEVFLLEAQKNGKGPQFVLRYHGWIDDRQDESKITSRDFQTALDAFLAGKDVPKAETKAFGCAIKRVEEKGPSATP
jgi:peroxiredoxin